MLFKNPTQDDTYGCVWVKAWFSPTQCESQLRHLHLNQMVICQFSRINLWKEAEHRQVLQVQQPFLHNYRGYGGLKKMKLPRLHMCIKPCFSLIDKHGIKKKPSASFLFIFVYHGGHVKADSHFARSIETIWKKKLARRTHI